ncbi:DUF4902 domain-containing protein [Acidithiobacillus sp.]|uniref:DUF4902 domain-containing protein n=1 Tax=Acidithiobacillus sp. TaxID=1872118 RepID=UPI00262E765B|nr:DUF4902 domain-containing protein [Acidithiobacillus sp.]MDD5280461.1 DUF4902 domain-containing protein [Acidithiobacillus sp.]
MGIMTKQLKLRVWPDGYVRLESVKTLPILLEHWLSELDLEKSSEVIYSGLRLTNITGFTEWVSKTSPAITLGWDWELSAVSGIPGYRRTGSLRSNVMLTDEKQADIGEMGTDKLLSEWIDGLEWEKAVHAAITKN